MKSWPYQLSLTAVNLMARGAYFIVFVLIGNLYGSNETTDTVFLTFAPMAIVATVIAGIGEIVIMPYTFRAQARKCSQTFLTLLCQRALVATLAFGPVVIAISFVVLGRISLTALLLVPIPALAAINGIYASQLNVAGRFRTAAFGPVYGAALAGLTLLSVPISELGLVLTLLCYELGRALGVFLHGRNILADARDSAPEAAPQLLNESLRGVWHQGLGSLLVALNPLVDMLFARTLGAGAVSSVEYANRMLAVIPLLFSGPLMAFHSHLSAIANHGKLPLHDVYRAALRLGLIALVVGALLIWITTYWLIDWMYGWGRMDDKARDSLARLLAAYLLGTAPYVVSLLYVRAFSAVARASFITKAAMLMVLLNAALDWLLIQFFGLTGLGLATSVTYLSVTIYLHLALRRIGAYTLH